VEPSILAFRSLSALLRRGAFVLPILIATVLPSPALAADIGPWKSLGPLGSKGSVSAVAIDAISGAIYVAGYSGISKSVDGGATWVEASSGLTPRQVDSLVLDPNSPSVLYAGTYGGGVFRSTDGAATWTNLNGSPSAAQALAIAPLTSSTLYAGTNGFGVFKTTDAGATWSRVNGMVLRTIYTIVIDPRASGIVYVGGQADYFSSTGLEKTTDGGSTWKSISTGPIPASAVALAINPASPSTVYAAQEGGNASSLIRSTDGGDSWLSISDTLPPLRPISLAIDAQSPQTVYVGTSAGVFKSSNGGLTWTIASAGLLPPVEVGVPSYIYALAIDPRSPNTVYAGTGGNGLFKTNDGGVTWNRLSGIFSNLNITALATDPSAPLTIYAAARAGNADWGIFKSIDGGLSWTERNVGISNLNLSVNTILIDPSTPSTVYLATFGSGVLKSSNSGASWVDANAGISQGEYPRRADLALDPTVPSTLYASTDTGLYRSNDGAATWTAINGASAFGSPLAVALTAPPTLYSGGGQSLDGGQSWISLTTGLTGLLTAIVVDPTSPSTVYAAASPRLYPNVIFPPPVTVNGVARTDDGGKSWRLINGGLTDTSVAALAVDPRGSRRIFAATSGDVFASTSGGDGWFSINDGLIPMFGGSVNALTVDFGPAPSLYAGTSFGGVFKRSVAVAAPPCVADSTTLCVNGGRFRVQVSWSVAAIGTNRSGQALPLTADTGAFWFFTPNNLELVVKVVDGRPFNGHFWVFAGALSDVAYEITVTDTVSGVIRSYVHAQGPPASVGDVTAF
jgi:photosystem II stability/assembly factor-like uncharacterized protein